MTGRISPETLKSIRNDINVEQVIHVLEIPWRKDDLKLRFICPVCSGLDTSIHPKINLSRCFQCQKNFNSIDLVMTKKSYAFRQAVEWLLTVRRLLETKEGQTLLTRLALKNLMR